MDDLPLSDPGKKRILIVDDNLTNLDMLYHVLTYAGYTTFVADTGTHALLQVEQNKPDLILLDVMMPDMDGFETSRRLKASPTTCDIPIIFLTVATQRGYKVQGFTNGGVDYITKPFNDEEVLARVHTHIALYDMRKQLERRNQELASFAHTVAHQLKSPLQAIMGLTELVQERETLSDKSAQYLDHVIDTTNSLHDVIINLFFSFP